MAALTPDEQAVVRAFLDAIAARFGNDSPVGKFALQEVITRLAMGSREEAFDYMRSVTAARD